MTNRSQKSRQRTAICHFSLVIGHRSFVTSLDSPLCNPSCALPPFSEGILPDEDSCTQLWQLLGEVSADRNRPRGDCAEPGSHSGAGARREDRISRFQRFLHHLWHSLRYNKPTSSHKEALS